MCALDLGPSSSVRPVLDNDGAVHNGGADGGSQHRALERIGAELVAAPGEGIIL